MEESTNHQENLYDAWKENPKLGIKIEVAIDGEVIASRTAFDFESAEENLGKLRRWYEKEQDKQVAEDEKNQEEVEELENKV